MSLTRTESERLAELLAEESKREKQKKFYRIFPEKTTIDKASGQVMWARHLYKRHLEFFEAGAKYRERCFMAANRVGKTVAGAFEMAAHLTGEYPDWWTGRRFDHPTDCWIAGKTNTTTRDIIQKEMFGSVKKGISGGKYVDGTGIVPGHALEPGGATWKSGFADLLDTIKVKHVSGEYSVCGVKSYEQGRGSFEGTAKHAIWPDEEPPRDVWDEMVIRTATTNGIVFMTFTPLEGLSETVLQFMPENMRPKELE